MAKRLLTVLITLTLICALALPAWAADIQVLVDGQALVMDVAPLIENSRTLVPLRAITERLGATVSWDPATRQATVVLDGQRLLLTVDSSTAYVDGAAKALEAPARIVNGRTLVPLRFLSENLAATVEWDETTRTVIITTAPTGQTVTPNVTVSTEQMESEVLNALNASRAKLSLGNLIVVDSLGQMARSHATDMANNNFFTASSPTNGDLAARSQAYGLQVSVEYRALGLPDAAAIANGILSGEQGSVLLTEEANFIGIGLYQASSSGNADIYAVVELITGEGFLLGERQQQLTGNQMTVSGYALEGAPLTVYLLDSNGNYKSRQTYTLTVNAQTHAFSTQVTLWQEGSFAIVLGNDSIIVDNRSS